jgi:peptide-methionine (S)-S-oxide reductase
MEIKNKQKVVFGGGCFWCTEAVFKMLKGIISVEPGYAGGTKANPTYEEVSSGTTGHAEAIQLEYDPRLIKFEELLTVFFASHDPTTKDRQGNDVGEQYRSMILCGTEKQMKEAEKFIKDLNASNEHGSSIVTEVKMLDAFYSAESYHKDYYHFHKDQPYCQVVINPKLKKVQEKFAELLKAN